MEMLLTGEPVPAREALEMGLVNRVTPDDELDAAVERLARTDSVGELADPRHRQAGLLQADRAAAPGGIRPGAEVMVDNLLKEDAHEGISAFLEKRTPHWNH